MTGLHIRFREMLATTIHEALPDHRYQVPNPSIIPLVLAFVTAATFICFMFTPWAIPVSMATCAVVFFLWFWSNSHEHRPPYSPESDNHVYGEEEAA